jgi:hypothetical protein
MKKILKRVAANRSKFPFAVLILLGVVIAIGVDPRKFESATPADAGGIVQKMEKPQAGEKLEENGSGTDETEGSDSHPSPRGSAGTSPSQQSSAGTSRLPLQVLATGNQTVEERVRQLQGMRGISLSKEERESALSFLAGGEVTEGMGKGSLQWLADELLTVMRLQEPPWDGLAAELGKVAFQPGTDPVVRDYIMQHLGHLWEQSGPRDEIEEALWQAVESSDETTPGTALIALGRGYKRDGQEEGLAKVRQQALTLAQDPNTALAVRVTALSIAGDGGGTELKRLAGELAGNPETPVILRKVAERVVK